MPHTREWPIGTILNVGNERWRVLGYRHHGQVVRLGRLSGLDSPVLDWQFQRSLGYVKAMVDRYGK